MFLRGEYWLLINRLLIKNTCIYSIGEEFLGKNFWRNFFTSTFYQRSFYREVTANWRRNFRHYWIKLGVSHNIFPRLASYRRWNVPPSLSVHPWFIKQNLFHPTSYGVWFIDDDLCQHYTLIVTYKRHASTLHRISSRDFCHIYVIILKKLIIWVKSWSIFGIFLGVRTKLECILN